MTINQNDIISITINGEPFIDLEDVSIEVTQEYAEAIKTEKLRDKLIKQIIPRAIGKTRLSLSGIVTTIYLDN